MHLSKAAALVVLALGSCSRPGVTSEAPAVTDADRAAVLKTLGLSADQQGLVPNECGERSVPRYLSAELGGNAGTAILFAMSGGPTTASCYGDGPDLHLMMRDGASWREIYSARGRMLISLPTSTAGVRDIGDGGPGFSFPVWVWNGTRYVPAGREISDAELSKVKPTYLP